MARNRPEKQLRRLAFLVLTGALLTAPGALRAEVTPDAAAGLGNDGTAQSPPAPRNRDPAAARAASLPARPVPFLRPALPANIGAIFSVTSAADTGAGTLRAALNSANALPGTDAIAIALGGGLHTITPLSPLPIVTSPIVLDGTQGTDTPFLEITGTLAGTAASGLVIRSGGSLVRGLIINGFGSAASLSTAGYGLVLDIAGGNTIECNYIGTNAAGTAARANFRSGLLIQGASGGNLVGGLTPQTRNVISGNNSSGVTILAGNPGGNRVRGNFIGLNATGTAIVPNSGNGVFISGVDDTIGGAIAGARNVISGNSLPGVAIAATGLRTVVLGNYIGTDVTGSLDLGNVQNGVLTLASDNVIGDGTALGRNVIGGNGFPAVYLSGAASVRNKVMGNYLLTDATGTVALGDGNGINLDGCSNNTIGGTTPGAGNVIGGTPFTGISFINGANGNRILGNLIGLDATGLNPLPNDRGILVNNCPSNVIGGTTPAERNIISANTSYGIEFRSAGAGQNRVSGNFIGTDVSGLLDRGNGLHGIAINASQDTIGGIAVGAGNVIAFNHGAGVFDSTGTACPITANSIFSNGGKGIEIFPPGLTPNDSLDADPGANGLQNFPILDSAVVAGSSWKIYGRLDSKPSATYQVSVFRSDQCDPSHFGEGKLFITSGLVTTNAAGRTPFTFGIPYVAGPWFITATATDVSGNTSEFSTPRASGTVRASSRP